MRASVHTTGLATLAVGGLFWLSGYSMVHADEGAAVIPPRQAQAAQAQSGSTPSAPAKDPAVVQVQAIQASPVSVLGGEQSPTLPVANAPESNVPPPWNKVPPTEPTPRFGYFIMPPAGCGFYSLKDLILDKERDNPPFFPYRGVLYDNDFRYLDDPSNTAEDLFDPLKRIHLGDDWLLSFGGEERVRYMNEHNGYLTITDKDNDYTLLRTRVYGDLWYKDIFRVYVEFLDAQSFGQDLPPHIIDVDHADLLNLFGELKLAEIDDNGLYVRVGRQELLYGSQRLVSPLDWANTRRTFQGVKAYWHSEDLDLDAFWVQPVIVNPTHFDSPDSSQSFAGFWASYRPDKQRVIDLYYLYLDNSHDTFTGSDASLGGYHVSTVGSRYAGDYEHILWDFEGMYQFGDWVNQQTEAEAFTTGAGYDFKGLRLDPQFWVYYDFASGSHNPNTTDVHATFNQLFPLSHAYFGGLELVGRENIEDLSLQGTIYPTKWITTGLQYHWLWLDSATDALYNAGGVPIRRDPTGRAGRDVGTILDLFTNFHISQHQDVLIGFNQLFSGSFIKNTGGPDEISLFYAQYTFRW